MKRRNALAVCLLLAGGQAAGAPADGRPTKGDQPGAAPASAPSAPVAEARHAPIVVSIVVDQLAAWVLRERIDKLPADGGFARLRKEGKYFQEMAYGHAITETAPGHASLFTGKIPREHGIVANDVVNSEGKKQAIIADPSSPLVGLDGGSVGGAGASVDKLQTRSDLVASAFRRRYAKGQGIVAALSLKDRGALFAAGDNADIAVWFDPKYSGAGKDGVERGAFVTTRRYASDLKSSGLAGLVRNYLSTDPNDKRDGVERLEAQPWKSLDPAWLTDNAGAPGDSDYTGFVGTHVASQAVKPGSAFRALPETDRLLLTMALQVLKSDTRNLPAFISVSLSANDYIGHMFGPDSWEAWDELRRLDATLAWFFKELDAFGPQSWSLVLTADHGTVTTEDDGARPKCGDNIRAALDSGKPCSGGRAHGSRVFVEDFKKEAESIAGKVGLKDGKGAPIDKVIAGVVFPYIYLTDAAKARVLDDPRARAQLSGKLESELKKKFKSLLSLYDVASFREYAECPDDHTDPMAALVCHSVSPSLERGGDFYIVLRPGSFFDPELIKGAGISHGSPYGYDRFVPLLVRDPSQPGNAGKVEGKRVPFSLFHDELVRMIQGTPAASAK